MWNFIRKMYFETGNGELCPVVKRDTDNISMLVAVRVSYVNS